MNCTNKIYHLTFLYVQFSSINYIEYYPVPKNM